MMEARVLSVDEVVVECGGGEFLLLNLGVLQRLREC